MGDEQATHIWRGRRSRPPGDCDGRVGGPKAHRRSAPRGRSSAYVALQGWPAVIALAAVTERGPADGYQIVSTISGRRGHERPLAETQRALPDIAVIGGVNSVADDVLGTNIARAAGAELWHAGLVQLARRSAISRFIPLMRTFLRARLAVLPTDRVPRPLDRVIAAYIGHGRWDDAFEAMADFRRPDQLPALLTAALPQLLASGRIATVERWLTFAESNSSPRSSDRLSSRRGCKSPGEHLGEACSRAERSAGLEADSALSVARTRSLPMQVIFQAPQSMM